MSQKSAVASTTYLNSNPQLQTTEQLGIELGLPLSGCIKYEKMQPRHPFSRKPQRTPSPPPFDISTWLSIQMGRLGAFRRSSRLLNPYGAPSTSPDAVEAAVLEGRVLTRMMVDLRAAARALVMDIHTAHAEAAGAMDSERALADLMARMEVDLEVTRDALATEEGNRDADLDVWLHHREDAAAELDRVMEARDEAVESVTELNATFEAHAAEFSATQRVVQDETAGMEREIIQLERDTARAIREAAAIEKEVAAARATLDAVSSAPSPGGKTGGQNLTPVLIGGLIGLVVALLAVVMLLLARL